MNVEAGSAIEGNPFKPGDVVQLKSGGPPMTVTMVVGPDTYCTWFSLAAIIQQLSSFSSPTTATFPWRALDRAKNS